MSTALQDLSLVPLGYMQSGPLRTVIETELAITVLDLAEQGRDITVTQEQAIHDVVVPAIFFKAMEEWNLANAAGEIMNMTLECVHWVRTEVRKAVKDMLGIVG